MNLIAAGFVDTALAASVLGAFRGMACSANSGSRRSSGGRQLLNKKSA
jgi:hypothetical protein